MAWYRASLAAVDVPLDGVEAGVEIGRDSRVGGVKGDDDEGVGLFLTKGCTGIIHGRLEEMRIFIESFKLFSRRHAGKRGSPSRRELAFL